MKNQERDAGFTLLELLTAAAISVVLAGLVLAVTDGALRQWRRTQANLSLASEAQVILDQIQRDLQCAGTTGEGTWLHLSLADSTAPLAVRGWVTAGASLRPTAASLRPLPQEEPDGSEIFDARFGVAGAWLRLITTTSESSSEPALPRAVSWQIVRRPPTGPVSPGNPAPPRYLLYRSAIGAADTFRVGLDVTAAAYAGGATAPGPTRAPSTLTNPSAADAFGLNVVDFGCWVYRRGASGELVRLFPVAGGDLEFLAGPAGESEPRLFAVMIRILTAEGADQLGELEAGRPTAGWARDEADAWWAIVEAHSRLFIRWIEAPRRL